MSAIQYHSGSDSELVPFKDEIFQWPVAKMNNFDAWDLLFEKYVTHPVDQKNLLLASPQFFGPLLKERKTSYNSYLLGEVLHILHRNDYLKITIAEFLKYRTISKSCKLSIDNSLTTNNPCFQNLDGIDHDHKFHLDHPCWLRLPNGKILWWLRHFCSPSALLRAIPAEGPSPIPCGSFTFENLSVLGDVTLNETLTLYLLSITEILSTFGSQVYHFRFEIKTSRWSDSVFERAFNFYQLLCFFLNLMPNLRTLTVEDWCLENVELECRRLVESTTLPTLPHLNVLTAKNVFPGILKALLSKYGANLTKLSVLDAHWNLYDHTLGSDMLASASSLTELKLPLVRTDANIEQFLKDNVKQPLLLTSLSITIQVQCGKTKKLLKLLDGLSKLFEKSNRLSTLHLLIVNQGVKIFKRRVYCIQLKKAFISSDARLKLPLVKRLWIYSFALSFNSIDFILGLQDSLEELVLNLELSVPKKKSPKEVIQFFDYWHKMQESNVWKLMPKLRRITIRCSKYNKGNGFFSFQMAKDDKFPEECYEFIRPAEVGSST